MLSDFAEKKESCCDHKNQNFLKSKKSALAKGLTHAFGQKMPFFSLLRFGQIRLQIMLNYLEEKKKKPFLTIKKRTEFFKVQKIAFFFKGVNPYFWPKSAKFFLI